MSLPRILDRFRFLHATGGAQLVIRRAATRALRAGSEQFAKFAQRLDLFGLDHAKLDPDIKALLAANRARRDSCAGQSCLLVGSGPSAARLDRAMAGNRRAIVVNEMFGPVRAAGVRLSAIVISDASYFDGDASKLRVLSEASAAAEADDALLILPAARVGSLTRMRVIDPVRVLPIVETSAPISCLRQGRILDLTQPLPDLLTSTHVGLAGALYLGYHSIALIGVDLTFVGMPTVPIAHGYGRNPYFDDVDKKSAQDAFLHGHGWHWAEVLRHVARQLDAYEMIGNSALTEGRELINFSEDSLLATLPQFVQGPIS